MVPARTKSSIDLYVDEGYPIGSFMYALLTGNLFEAMVRADRSNRENIYDICQYLQNYVPMVCFGSTEKVSAWFKLHRENPHGARIAAECDKQRRANFKG